MPRARCCPAFAPSPRPSTSMPAPAASGVPRIASMNAASCAACAPVSAPPAATVRRISPAWTRYGPSNDRITAPSFAFGDAANYYRTQSAIRYLSGIRLPVLLVQAKDDTFVPSRPSSRRPCGAIRGFASWPPNTAAIWASSAAIRPGFGPTKRFCAGSPEQSYERPVSIV